MSSACTTPDHLATTLPNVHWTPDTPPHRDHPPYDEMLEHGVSWCPELGVVLVASHDLVLTVLTEASTYSAANTIGPGLTIGQPPAIRIFLNGVPAEPTVLMNADGANHRRMRYPYRQAFSRERVQSRMPIIRARAAELVAGLRPAGLADLHKHFALPFVSRPVNDLFGVPPEDALNVALYCRAVRILLARTAPEHEQLAAAEVIVEAYEEIDALLAQRAREHPTGRRPEHRDLLDDLVHGSQLTPAEMFFNVLLSRIAADETTEYLLVSTVDVMIRNGLWTKARNASPFERHRIITRGIQETLRARSPHRGLMRITTRPVTLGGHHLPEDTPLLVCTGAANLDPNVFPDPHRIDIDRPNLGQHVGFGTGPHRCIGEHLAHKEVQLAIEALMELPDLHLLEPDEREHVASPYVGGLKTLPVSWHTTHTVAVAPPGGPGQAATFDGRWIVDPQLRSNERVSAAAVELADFASNPSEPRSWRAGAAITGAAGVAIYLHHWDYHPSAPALLLEYATLGEAEAALGDDHRIPGSLWQRLRSAIGAGSGSA